MYLSWKQHCCRVQAGSEVEDDQTGHDISVVCEVPLRFGGAANPDTTLVSSAAVALGLLKIGNPDTTCVSCARKEQ